MPEGVRSYTVIGTGHIEHLLGGTVTLASHHPGAADALDDVAVHLNEAGVEASTVTVVRTFMAEVVAAAAAEGHPHRRRERRTNGPSGGRPPSSVSVPLRGHRSDRAGASRPITSISGRSTEPG